MDQLTVKCLFGPHLGAPTARCILPTWMSPCAFLNIHPRIGQRLICCDDEQQFEHTA